MAPSTLQETVTVTGEAPLIETQSSELAGNIDPRQVQDLPSAGRNWMSLALLAPGNRTNAQGALPVQDRGDVREFQLNVDGLQVTANLGTGNQARYSNDAIAEFQFISNRFDATQGRSSGVQVNAVTKSGANQLERHVRRQLPRQPLERRRSRARTRVLPYKNQQYSGTIGGPIILNKLHYFGNYEYEHQPLTSIWTTPYPAFNVTRDRHASRQPLGRAARRGTHVEDAPDGEGESFEPARSVRHGQLELPGGDREERGALDGCRRRVHHGAQQPRGQHRARRLRVVRHQPVEPDDVVESLAGGQRHHQRRTRT